MAQVTTKRIRAGRGKKRKDGLTEIQHDFLETLKRHPRGNISAVCEAMGIDRTQHYALWKKNDAYMASFEAILGVVKASREDVVYEMLQRAGDEGLEVEVIEQAQELRKGKMVTVRQTRRVTKTPQVMAIIWENNYFKGNPARLEITGRDAGPIEVRNRAMEELVGSLEAMAIRLNGNKTKKIAR